MPVNINQLESPKSRAEAYLHFICGTGKIININQLPIPKSRIEWLLLFLCENLGNIGGGGGQPFVGLTDVSLNGDIITFIKSNGTTKEVRLTDFIRGELTQVGGIVQHANKIPQLNADGKVDISMIPDLSINNIHSATDNQDAENLLNSGTVKIGDTIIVKDTGSVYLYVNDQGANFNDKTIEIAFANGAVKMVNGEIPNPQGNVTVKAEHIDYDDAQIGLGGTTVQEAIQKINEKFVSNIEFEDTTRTLKKTINGQEEDVVSGLVRKWGDLEYTTQSTTLKNIFDKTTQVEDNKQYYFGNIRDNQEWKIIKIPCSVGKEYTITKNLKHDSRQFGVYDSKGSLLYDATVSGNKLINNRMTYRFTVPTTLTDASYFVTSLFKADTNENDVMVFEGNLADNEIPVNYIPFMDGASVLVDSNEVALTFDKAGTSLTSVTVHSAIKELDKKIANSGVGTVKRVNGQTPNQQGDVVVNSEHIGYDNTTSNLVATDVKGAIDELKRDMALIESSNIYIVENNQALNTLLGQNKLQKGDIVYIIDSNGVVDFNGVGVANNGNPVAMIYDSDIQIVGNKLRIFSKFDTPINISADVVSYNDRITQLGEGNVQGAIEKLKEKIDNGVTSVTYDGDKTLSVVTGGVNQDYNLTPLLGIKSINSEEGVDGNIDLSYENTDEKIDFKVENEIFATITYITDNQVQEIKDLFTF